MIHKADDSCRFEIKASSISAALLLAIDILGWKIEADDEICNTCQEMNKPHEDVEDLKGRLASVSSQLNFFIKETETLISYSKSCLDRYSFDSYIKSKE